MGLDLCLVGPDHSNVHTQSVSVGVVSLKENETAIQSRKMSIPDSGLLCAHGL